MRRTYATQQNRDRALRLVQLSNPSLIARELLKNEEDVDQLSHTSIEGLFSGFQLTTTNTNFEQNLKLAKKCFEKVFPSGPNGQNLPVLREYVGFLARSTTQAHTALKALEKVQVDKLDEEQLLYLNKNLIPFVCTHVVHGKDPRVSLDSVKQLVEASAPLLRRMISKLGEQQNTKLDSWVNANPKQAPERIATLTFDAPETVVSRGLEARAALLESHSAVCRALAKMNPNQAYKYFTEHFKLYGYLLVDEPEMKFQVERKDSDAPLLVPHFTLTYEPILVKMMKRPHVCYSNLLKLSYSFKTQRDVEHPETKVTILDEIHRVVEANASRAKYVREFNPEKDLATGARVFDPNRKIMERADGMKYIPRKTIPPNVDGLPR